MMELDKESFTKTIAKGNAVVDFWAPWCGPCRMMAPFFEEAGKSAKNVTFAKVNVDENGEIAQGLGIRGIPTIIFFKDGKEVGRTVGMLNKQAIEQKVKEIFG